MKEKKPTETKTADPQIRFDRSEFFDNRLALPQGLKTHLAEKGLDYRFLNASQFRLNGGHQSHWTVFKLEGNASDFGLNAVTPEGYIVRGDLILGTRPKMISREHKKYLAERNARNKGYNKQKAKEMKQLAKDHGVEDHSRILEGYDE